MGRTRARARSRAFEARRVPRARARAKRRRYARELRELFAAFDDARARFDGPGAGAAARGGARFVWRTAPPFGHAPSAAVARAPEEAAREYRTNEKLAAMNADAVARARAAGWAVHDSHRVLAAMCAGATPGPRG